MYLNRDFAMATTDSDQVNPWSTCILPINCPVVLVGRSVGQSHASEGMSYFFSLVIIRKALACVGPWLDGRRPTSVWKP